MPRPKLVVATENQEILVEKFVTDFESKLTSFVSKLTKDVAKAMRDANK